MPLINDIGFNGLNRRSIVEALKLEQQSVPELQPNPIPQEQDTDVRGNTPQAQIPADQIGGVSADSFETGEIASQQIIMKVIKEAGDVYLGMGTFDAVTWTAQGGLLMGIDDSDSDAVKFYFGDSTTGNFFSYDSVTGILILNGSQLTNESIYGDGSDGAATISSNTSLSSDAFYTDLTIDSSSVLTTNGYRVFCTGTLTIESGSTISWSGNAGAAGGDGGDGTGGAPGAAGAAGVGGAALGDGSVPGSLMGPNGQAGGAGVRSVGGGAVAGNAGTNGTAGTDQDKSMVTTSSAGAGGGKGGTANGTGAGGAASTGGAAGTDTDTILNEIRTYVSAYMLFDGQDQKWFNSSPGTGGAGSGGSGGVDAQAAQTASSGGGGGGGGTGSSGGTVPVFARIIVNEGAIEAHGADGGAGGAAGDPIVLTPSGSAAAGGSGGGAGGSGGNGGVVLLVYGNYSGSGTKTATAGATGATGAASTGVAGGSYSTEDGDAGTAGNAGVTGLVIELQV